MVESATAAIAKYKGIKRKPLQEQWLACSNKFYNKKYQKKEEESEEEWERKGEEKMATAIYVCGIDSPVRWVA